MPSPCQGMEQHNAGGGAHWPLPADNRLLVEENCFTWCHSKALLGPECTVTSMYGTSNVVNLIARACTDVTVIRLAPGSSVGIVTVCGITVLPTHCRIVVQSPFSLCLQAYGKHHR
jgi:hypothetical protein